MYLQKIQKVFNIVEIVAKVIMVVAFVGGGILFIAGILGISGSEQIVTKIGGINFVTPVIHINSDMSLTAEGAVMLTEGIRYILIGVIMIFATNYLAQERKDGTPFTEKGAASVSRLGIITIVLSVAAAIIQATILTVMKLTEETEAVGNEEFVTTGLLLLFFSMILRYGAQLREGKSDETAAEDSEK